MIRPRERSVYAQLRTFGRFIVVGCTNTALTYGIFRVTYPALGHMPGGTGVTQAIAYGTGAVLSFILNRSWTFRSTDGGRRQLARFVVAQFGALLVSALAMEIAVTSARLPSTPAWIGVTGATTVLNFVVMRSWVFAPGAPSLVPVEGT